MSFRLSTLLGMLCAIPLTGFARAHGQAPTITAVREILLDGSRLDFVPISCLVVDPGGRMYVWQGEDSRIRQFRPDGKEGAPFGRAGEGPGEFRMLSVGGMVGDTLWISDPMLRRTTFIAPTGVLSRIHVWPSTVSSGDGQFAAGIGVQPMVVEPAGTQIVEFGRGTREHLPDWWQPATAGHVVLRVDSLGNFLQLLAALPPVSSVCGQPLPGPNPGSIPIPFCHGTYVRVLPEKGMAFSLGPEGGPGTEGAYILTARRFDGSSVYAVTHRAPAERVTRAAVDSARSALLSNPMPPGLGERIERAFDVMKTPSTYPSVTGLFVGKDGTVWVRLRPSRSSSRWLVVSPEGVERGTLELPPSFTFLAADGDRVWGTTRDEDDIPSVVRYRIH